MSLGGLIGSALAGGVAGYGASKVDELRKEAEQLRQESMLRMQKQFSMDAAKMTNEFAVERDNANRAYQTQTREEDAVNRAAERASDRAFQMEKTKEDRAYQDERDKANRSHAERLANIQKNDNKGELSKTYNAALEMYDGDKEKALAFVERKMGKGQMSEFQQYKLVEDLQKIEEMGVSESNYQSANILRAKLGLPVYEKVMKDKGSKGVLGLGKSDPVYEYVLSDGKSKENIDEQQKKTDVEQQKTDKNVIIPKLKPGQRITQNGVKYVVNGSGVPEPLNEVENVKKDNPKQASLLGLTREQAQSNEMSREISQHQVQALANKEGITLAEAARKLYQQLQKELQESRENYNKR